MANDLIELLRRPYGNLTGGEREQVASSIEALESENARLKVELRWYANRENWTRHVAAPRTLSPAVLDSGKRARSALRDTGKEGE